MFLFVLFILCLPLMSYTLQCGLCRCFNFRHFMFMDCSGLNLREIPVIAVNKTGLDFQNNNVDCNSLMKYLSQNPQLTWINVKRNTYLNCDCIYTIRNVTITSDCPPSQPTQPSFKPSSYLSITSTIFNTTSRSTFKVIPSWLPSSSSTFKHTIIWILSSSFGTFFTVIIIVIIFKIRTRLRSRNPSSSFELEEFYNAQQTEEHEEETIFDITEL